MKYENDARKRLIAAAVRGSDVLATVYDAGRRYGTDREGRAACLSAVVLDLAPARR